MKVAGVNLENTRLNISIVEKKIGVIKPVASEDIYLPQPEHERYTILKETFQKLKDKYKVKDIVVGLGFSNFLHSIIDTPLLSKADMKNALFYELEKYLPLPPEEYIYDFTTVEKVRRSAKNLVFSVRRDKMNGLLSVIKESGLNLAAIRCSFIEAINEFIAFSNTKNFVFIYATDDAYSIIVLRNQRPVLLKTILKGKNAISEFEKFVKIFTGTVYISGTPDPELSHRLNAKNFPLTVSHSIALSALRKPKIDLNFMPSEFLPMKKDYFSYALSGITVMAVLLFFLTEIYPYYRDYTALNGVNKEIEKIKSKASELLETRKKMESLNEKKMFLNEFQGKKNLNVRVLTELSRLLPKDTWLTGMSVDEKGKIEIEGFSKHAIGIIEPLNKSKLFTNIRFTSPIILQNNEEKFLISMEIAG